MIPGSGNLPMTYKLPIGERVAYDPFEIFDLDQVERSV